MVNQIKEIIRNHKLILLILKLFFQNTFLTINKYKNKFKEVNKNIKKMMDIILTKMISIILYLTHPFQLMIIQQMIMV